MKILVVGSRVPWPLNDGGAIAIYRMLQGLSQAGAEVLFFSYNTHKHHVSATDLEQHFSFCRVFTFNIDTTPRILGALKNLISGENYNISRFYSAEAIRALSAVVKDHAPDLVHFDSLYSTPLLPAVRGKNIPLVLRQHNAEFKIWEKLAATASNPFKKWYFSHLAKQLKNYELATLREFDAVIPITNEDKDVFLHHVPGVKCHVCSVGLPETVQKATFNPAEPAFFHIGSMEWMPNVQGVQWLVSEVWPLLRQKLPNAVLHLAGKGMPANDFRFTAPGVVVHGEVPSSEHFMMSGGIMCVPLFSGGGIRVKLLEAMSMGIPVVSTDIGAAGAGAHHGTHLLLASTADEFAQAMQNLAIDAELRMRLTNSAEDMVSAHYGLATLSADLLKFYKSL
jgi:glycosyltransferase involved in cell wall biosynthesis